MTREMKIGQLAFFYHSSCAEPGIAGIIKIVSAAYPDETQFDAQSEYFDPKSATDDPRWFNVDVELVKKTRFLPLRELKSIPALSDLHILKRGNRLSITPVSDRQWKLVEKIIAA